MVGNVLVFMQGFNLWIKKARTKGYMIRECFPINSVPNENATYEVTIK